MSPLLIIGIGNTLRGDDGLGPHVIERLQLMTLPGATVVKATGEGTALIELWREYEAVILIDAFSSGSAPGLLRSFDVSVSPVPAGMRGKSSHLFSVSEAIELSRSIGFLPSTTLIYGIEGENFDLGAQMSETVLSRVNELIDMIGAAVQKLSDGQVPAEAGPARK